MPGRTAIGADGRWLWQKPASHPRDRLIRVCGNKPASIAAITFTNREAKKLRERAARLLAGKDSKGLIHHLPSLGLRILRKKAALARLKPALFDCGTNASQISCEILKTTD